jgi:hypothetical protein
MYEVALMCAGLILWRLQDFWSRWHPAILIPSGMCCAAYCIFPLAENALEDRLYGCFFGMDGYL